VTDQQDKALVKYDAAESIIGEDEDYNVLAYSGSLGATILVDEMGEVWYAQWTQILGDYEV